MTVLVRRLGDRWIVGSLRSYDSVEELLEVEKSLASLMLLAEVVPVEEPLGDGWERYEDGFRKGRVTLTCREGFWDVHAGRGVWYRVENRDDALLLGNAYVRRESQR